jgi:acyl dehydratase
MLDRSAIGARVQGVTVTAESGQMRLFADSTGQTDPIFFSEAAAKAAGYRSIVGPPTFAHALFAIGSIRPFDLFEKLGIKLEDTLHGEQSFEYHALICAGDCIRFEGSVTDVYTKKDGALTFLVQELRARNQFDEDVALMRTTTIVVARNGHG